MDVHQSKKNRQSGHWRRGVIAIALLGLFLSPVPTATADARTSELSRSYSSEDAGHPVRILYYVIYPVGFLLERVILKPAWWLGQRQPFRTLFGVDRVESDL